MSPSRILVVIALVLYGVRLLTLPQPSYPDGTKIKITATLKNEPTLTSSLQKFDLMNFAVVSWRYPEYHYGDRLEVTGVVKNGLSLNMPDIILLEAGGGSIYTLRRRILGLYHSFLPEPQSSLLGGIVLGSKEGMPTIFYQALQKTGTMHMVVASGMNVVLVSGTLTGLLLAVLSRRYALLIAILATWFYVFLSGAQIPVVRAGLMTTFALTANLLGREGDAWRGFVAAAILILLLQPLSILDIGFQLSFAATFGILYFGPRFSKLLKRLPKVLQIETSQTLAAQTATAPLLIYHFHQFSLLSPVVNLLVVFVVAPLLQLGAVIAVVGLIFPKLGQLLSWLAWPLLTYFVKMVEAFGTI